jgi:tetratricopeptide (TPR) repeat protein
MVAIHNSVVGKGRNCCAARRADTVSFRAVDGNIYQCIATNLFRYGLHNLKTEVDTLQMTVYSNLGILQFCLYKADEAVKYYRQSLEIAEARHDSVAIANMLNNIGNAYMTIDKAFEKSVPDFEQCVEIGHKTGYGNAVRVAGINLAQMNWTKMRKRCAKPNG